jgi:hypothetical protein
MGLTFEETGGRSSEAVQRTQSAALGCPFEQRVRVLMCPGYLKMPFSIFSISSLAYSAAAAFPSSIARAIKES